MSAFWEGVVAGYGIAIPVGVIAILIFDIALRRGFPSGFMAGAGAATVDLFYATVAAVAGAALAVWLIPFAQPLKVLSGAVLLLLGGYGVWRALHQPSPKVIGEPLSQRSLWATYLQFAGLTLLNPLTIVYFGALIIGSGAASVATPSDRLAFIIGAALASLSWQSLLAGAGAFAGRRMPPRLQTAATLVGNFIVILLGLRIVYQLLAL